jgi:hypothetical protein
VQRHLSSSPDCGSRAGAAAAVVVRANPLYNMMEEEYSWWRVDGGDECRVRALGQRAPVDSTSFLLCFAFSFVVVLALSVLFVFKYFFVQPCVTVFKWIEKIWSRWSFKFLKSFLIF